MSCSAKRDPNGTWHIQYRWTDWTGTKKKSQKRGFKTKKEAEEWYAHFIMQQTSDPTMTLNDFWEIYKADMEKRLRKTTMKQKEYVMKDKVLPYFGNTPINAITAPMIRKWQGEMIDKGFKPTYLKTINNQLSSILNYIGNKLLYAMEHADRIFTGILLSFDLRDLLVGVTVAVILKLLVWQKQSDAKKLRKGIEYGSARWGTAEDIKPYIRYQAARGKELGIL